VYAVESLSVPGTAWVYRADFTGTQSNNVWFGNYVSYFFSNINPSSAGANPVWSFNGNAGTNGSLPMYWGANMGGVPLVVCNNWSGTTDQAYPGLCDPSATNYTPHPGGNEVQIGMYVGTQIPNNTWSYGVAYGATVHVNDVAPPRNVTVTPASSVSSNGWMDTDAAATVAATQPGLGVGQVGLLNAGGSAIANTTLACQTAPSNFGTYNPCPQSASQTLSLASAPEGISPIFGQAQNVMGYAAQSSPLTVKIDRTAPDASLSGSLWDRRNQNDGTDIDLQSGTYPLRVAATDGSMASPGSQRSGVASIDIYVDGVQQTGAMHAAQTCPDGSCPLTLDWSYNTANYNPGAHTIKVTSADILGHVATTTWTITQADPADYSNQNAPPANSTVYSYNSGTAPSDSNTPYDGGFTADTGAASTAPYPAPFYYVVGRDPNTAYQKGCAAAQQHRRGYVFLDFGSMVHRNNTDQTKSQGSAPGAGYLSFDTDRYIAQKYAQGFRRCSPTTAIRIAMTVANDLQNTSALGAGWGAEVHTLGVYLRQHGYNGYVYAGGGDDIEGTYSAPAPVYSFVQGFQSATSAVLVNVGSADGCPPAGSCVVASDAAGKGNNVWSQQDYWRLSVAKYGDTSIPQIYRHIQARQWQQMSLFGSTHYGKALYFMSPLSQGDTQQDGTYTASQAWSVFFNTLASSAATRQRRLPFNTFIAPGI